MPDPALEQLTEFAFEDASEAEFRAVRIVLADSLACVASAIHKGLASDRLQRVEDLAIAMSVQDLDDVDWDLVTHPGSVVVPAALACASEVGAPGESVAEAIASGYRVSAAIGSMLDPEFRHRWHATAICGAFGAGSAASILLGSDPGVLERTLGLIASSVGGLAAAPRARNGSAVFTRVAASSLGVLAARSALKDLPTPPGSFSAPGGLADVLTARPLRPSRGSGGVTDVSLRLFPVTGFAHAAVWAAGQVPLGQGPIGSVNVAVARAAAAMNHRSPWWDIPSAVGRTLLARDPFRCNEEVGVPFEVRLTVTDLPITDAAVEVEYVDGSRVEIGGSVPGSVRDPATEELLSKKAGLVLHVSGRDALRQSESLISSGMAAHRDLGSFLPSVTGH